MAANNSLKQQIIQWGCQYLALHGYTLDNNQPETVQIRPWSYVVRFATSDGYIYLKHTPELIALEASITQILYKQFHAPVPEIIAQNPDLNCFLMKDAGRLLREMLKIKFDAAYLCKAIDQFTSLQLIVADHLKVFLDIGVPDWRVNKLPDLFRQFLLQKDMLLADGLLENEINELEALLPRINQLCEKLSRYLVKASIIQPDFNDNNLLINEMTKNITIIDLGEIAISHPFFSLINCLHQVKKHYGLTEKDDAYLQILNVCFKNFLNEESRENLSDAFGIAEILYYVYSALANDRLMKACGQQALMTYQPGRLNSILKNLLSVIAIDR